MFTLLTDEYDSMVGSFQDSNCTEFRPLTSTTFDEALREAQTLFATTRKYKIRVRHWEPGPHQYDEYPRNPRLVYTWKD
jgi:hypothetical protein